MMKRLIMEKNMNKVPLLLLLFLVFISFSSVVAYSNDDNSVDLIQTTKYDNYMEEINDKSRYSSEFEIETLREKCVKHFRLSNGTYKMVNYGVPVHYLDNNGNWLDLYNIELEKLMEGDLRDIKRIPPDLPIFDDEDIGLYDTYISSTYPNNNYGYNTTIVISNDNSKTGLIKSLLTMPPTDSTITQARLNFLYYFGSGNTSNMLLGAYEVLSDWDEHSVKWSSNICISLDRISTYQTSSNATISNPLYGYFDITSLVQSWLVDTTPNYGIAIKYESGSANNLYIHTRENQGFHSSLIISYNMQLLPIDSGNYFIKNPYYDKYIQISDDDSNNNYNSNGALLELNDWNSNLYQRWEFDYLHNGYYRIKSTESEKVISIQSGDEGLSNVSIVQKTYDGSYNQQWQIIPTIYGHYKIKPRSSENYNTDLVMACVYSNSHYYVQQSEFINNNYFDDEWIFEFLSNKSIVLYGIEITGHNHLTSNQLVKQNLYDNGFNNVLLKYGSFTPTEVLNDIKNSKIVAIRSHGDCALDQNNNLLSTVVQTGSFSYFDHSNQLINGTYFLESQIQSTDYFDDTELVLFACCYSGYGGVGVNNLPSVAVANGAEVAIGFYGTVSCENANRWIGYFFDYLLSGYNVSESVAGAFDDIEDPAFYNVTVVGNAYYTIY